jgi:hypothetical protein
MPMVSSYEMEGNNRTEQMPRSQITEEVQVLKFFEEAPLEQAEMLFNIVKDKMRSRSGTNTRTNGTQKKKDRQLSSDPALKSTEAGGV